MSTSENRGHARTSNANNYWIMLTSAVTLPGPLVVFHTWEFLRYPVAND